MLTFKLNAQKQDLIRGHWVLIQISPNIATQERINIGVALIDQDGVLHVRLAKDLSRLKCLYRQLDVTEFEKGLSFLKAIMHGARVESFQDVNLFENIHFGEPKSAKGESPEQILSHLFKQMVALA